MTEADCSRVWAVRAFREHPRLWEAIRAHEKRLEAQFGRLPSRWTTPHGGRMPSQVGRPGTEHPEARCEAGRTRCGTRSVSALGRRLVGAGGHRFQTR